LEMLKKLELSAGDFEKIATHCRNSGIVFLSTPYSAEDTDLLDALGVGAFKIASGQIVEPGFLRHVAGKSKPLIVSTGMATLAEVEIAVRWLRDAGNENLVLLQCTTNYPSSLEDANLRAMMTMRDSLEVLVGYSDHTIGATAPTVAVALGAAVIEKHLTLDKNLPGPDQSCSADPEEFRNLVQMIREAETVLGSSLKAPSATESRNALGMRRSIVAVTKISIGSRISEAMITCKRPGDGISPTHWDIVVGSVAQRDILPDECLSWGDFRK
jgi:N-acetylneuraminate synthase/N,N'-diacetyllegionaminate synthase